MSSPVAAVMERLREALNKGALVFRIRLSVSAEKVGFTGLSQPETDSICTETDISEAHNFERRKPILKH